MSARIPIARAGTADAPWQVAAGSGLVWVANRGGGSGSIMVVNPSTNSVEETIQLAAKQRSGPVFGMGAAWVGTQAGLVRIDTATFELRTLLETTSVETVGVFDDQLWITVPEALLQLDPDTGDELMRVELEGAVWPSNIAIDETGAWVADGDDAVWHVDTSAGEVIERIPLENSPTTVLLADGAVWSGGWGRDGETGDGGCSVVYRIDAATHEVTARILVGRGGSSWIATHDGDVWSRPEPDVLLKIDPESAQVVEAFEGLPDSSTTSAVVSAKGSIWAANWSEGTVWRLDP